MKIWIIKLRIFENQLLMLVFRPFDNWALTSPVFGIPLSCFNQDHSSIFLDYLWLDTDKLNDVLESSDEPSSLPSQQQHHQQQQHHVQTEGHSEVLNNDVEQDIEDENCATVFSSSVKLKLKEESVNEEGNTIRKRK